MKISIVGSGYVGLVTGISFASFDNEVVFIDVDKRKIDLINEHKSPIYENGIEDLMLQTKDLYYATSDYEEAIQNSDITFLCVGTPSLNNGSINYQYIEEASVSLGKSLKNKAHRHCVVVKSTVLPGTTETLVRPILERTSGKLAYTDFGLGMNPEFLREGQAINDFLCPDRIIFGVKDDYTRSKLFELYHNIDSVKMVTSIKEAEMIKYVSNSFLATKISFSNEIGNICKKIGVDSWKIFDGVGLDSRISSDFFRSGIGYGGSCFPKDVKALQHYAKSLGETTVLLDAIDKINDFQPLKLVHLLRKHVDDLPKRNVGILGLSFKPNTDDIRESRVIPIVEALKTETNLFLYDPIAVKNFKLIYPNLKYIDTAEQLVEICDIILIVTEWEEFETLDYSGKIVIDGRRIVAAMNAATYEGVCW